MIFFRFIFLARSWASDSHYFIQQLSKISERVKRENNPLAFILYPEGTLVSKGIIAHASEPGNSCDIWKDTRPLSKKWADKCGIDDMRHTLLPRATGMHYALRALAPRIPDLHLLDMTVAYDGIPRNGYGQSYYTLRSVFLGGIPPPNIHIHLKLYNVNTDIPIGDVDVYQNQAPPRGRKEGEITKAESTTFERWLLDVWRQKDGLLENFLNNGQLAQANPGLVRCRIPLRLRRRREIVHGLGIFAPA